MEELNPVAVLSTFGFSAVAGFALMKAMIESLFLLIEPYKEWLSLAAMLLLINNLILIIINIKKLKRDNAALHAQLAGSTNDLALRKAFLSRYGDPEVFGEMLKDAWKIERERGLKQ